MSDPVGTFSVVIDATFGGFGKAATYTPPPDVYGADVSCTVIFDTQDTDIGGVGSRIFVANRKMEVRKSEVAAPMKNGAFKIGSDTYRILSEPKSEDPERLVWAFTVG